MKIRRARKDEIKKISEFSVKTFIEAFEHIISKEELEKRLNKRSVDFYNEVFDKDTILLAEEDGKLIGYIQFGDPHFPTIETTEEDQELQRVYVLSGYQGQGVGKKLIKTALNSKRLKDAKNIYLDVREDNIGAQRLYKSLGFEPVGRWDEDIIMVKRVK